MSKIEKLIFNKLPKDENGKEIKEFSEMLGYTYFGYYSEYGKGYVLVGGEMEDGEKAYQNTIYKTLIASGEDEEYAKAVAYEGEDLEMCLYFDIECFEKVEEQE